MSSLAKRYRLARADPGDFMPPNLLTTGAPAFGEPQRARLTAWLREAGWPREHMGIAKLEGYLVALIAWPVGVSSGAWMPRIWGETGWKVPTKIVARSQYEEFIGLIIGFLHELDRQLSPQPSRFESSVLRGLTDRAHIEALHEWGTGFMTAVMLGAQGLRWRSESAGAAIHTIVNATSSSAPLRPRALDELVSAVNALMGQRASRGPLGRLEIKAPAVGPFDLSESAEPATNARKPGKRSN
jgi:yecA family protein